METRPTGREKELTDRAQTEVGAFAPYTVSFGLPWPARYTASRDTALRPLLLLQVIDTKERIISTTPRDPCAGELQGTSVAT